jgi:uncharacterized protein YjiS (DUF1127 family)
MSTPELTTVLKSLAAKVRDWVRYREAVLELSKLSDHELGDIGVSRGCIEYVVRH